MSPTNLRRATQNIPLVERSQRGISKEEKNGPQLYYLLPTHEYERERGKKLVSMACRPAPTFHRSFRISLIVPVGELHTTAPFTWTEWQHKWDFFSLSQSSFAHLKYIYKKTHLIYLVDSNNDLCFYAADTVFHLFTHQALTGRFHDYYIGAVFFSFNQHSPRSK